MLTMLGRDWFFPLSRLIFYFHIFFIYLVKNIKKKLDKSISLFIAAAGQLREFRL